VTRRVILFVIVFATIHLGLTAVALVSSLYFTLPGEPGFDPVAAGKAAASGTVLELLAFPVLPLVISSPLPRAMASGLLGWLWFALNSLLWAVLIGFIFQFLLRRARTTERAHDAD
jgi:ABC-type transport system involved in multi-copper enzyme maturation permease subunit